MNAKEFYTLKKKHNLTEDCGVRLTGEELFELMEEYASQFHQPKEVKTAEDWSTKANDYTNYFMQTRDLTDEMIKEKALELCPIVYLPDISIEGNKNEDVNEYFREVVIDAIKWALSLKAPKIDLRGELIRYDKWMAKNHFGEEIPTAEKIIDEYLSQYKPSLKARQPITDIIPTIKETCDECVKEDIMYDEPEEVQSKMLNRAEICKAAYDNGFLNCRNWIERFVKERLNKMKAQQPSDEKIIERDKEVFIKNNLELCHKAFKDGGDHKNWKSYHGKILIKLAREKLCYKDTTYGGDIFYHLYCIYSTIKAQQPSDEDDDKIILGEPDDLSFLKQPSDKEIRKWALDFEINRIGVLGVKIGNIQHQDGLIEGAKAMRDNKIPVSDSKSIPDTEYGIYKIADGNRFYPDKDLHTNT
jgi:hypothetical protein